MTDNIMRAVQRGKHVTDEILRFTRPAEPRRRSLEVSRFLAAWGEHLAPSLEGLEITFDVPADAVHVAADPTQLAQIFTNLALNAHDAMQGGRGHLTIGARLVTDPDRSVQFTISDDGCGISSDRFAHIFEPLAASFKRIKNILRQAEVEHAAGVKSELLVPGPEKDLFEAFEQVREKAAGSSSYREKLTVIASLRPKVDLFFDKILVNDPNPVIRENRLALLYSLLTEFSIIADFSEIVTEGPNA